MSKQHLVFIGGGHTHALVLLWLAEKPIPDTQITLISNTLKTPYSGMLPGFIAGHYSEEDIHIDLKKLAEQSNIQLIHDQVIGLDLQRKTIQMSSQAELKYDKLSINTGSTPNLNIPGAKEYALGVKPISQLTDIWQQLLNEYSQKTQHWAVVGAGAAGVEIILAIAHRFKTMNRPIQLTLVYSGHHILPGYHRRLRNKALLALNKANITLVPECRVKEVTHNSLIAENNHQLSINQSLWCTPAVAPEWPKESGIATDDNGFIEVNAYLQSTSHKDVFACGDVASLLASPRPKAGVYAVRSAPFLIDNLRASLAEKPLQPARFQQDFLSLLALGEKNALGQRSGIAFSGNWVWRWKDRIDQRFMAQFKTQISVKRHH